MNVKIELKTLAFQLKIQKLLSSAVQPIVNYLTIYKYIIPHCFFQVYAILGVISLFQEFSTGDDQSIPAFELRPVSLIYFFRTIVFKVYGLNLNVDELIK